MKLGRKSLFVILFTVASTCQLDGYLQRAATRAQALGSQMGSRLRSLASRSYSRMSPSAIQNLGRRLYSSMNKSLERARRFGFEFELRRTPQWRRAQEFLTSISGGKKLPVGNIEAAQKHFVEPSEQRSFTSQKIDWDKRKNKQEEQKPLSADDERKLWAELGKIRGSLSAEELQKLIIFVKPEKNLGSFLEILAKGIEEGRPHDLYEREINNEKVFEFFLGKAFGEKSQNQGFEGPDLGEVLDSVSKVVGLEVLMLAAILFLALKDENTLELISKKIKKKGASLVMRHFDILLKNKILTRAAVNLLYNYFRVESHDLPLILSSSSYFTDWNEGKNKTNFSNN